MPTRAGNRRLALRGGTKPTPKTLSDEEFDGFYRQIYLPLIRRAIWIHRLDREDARDIVQDAFVLALTRMKTSGNPRAWLIQVVDHLALNYRRRRIRRASLARRWGLFEGYEGLGEKEGCDPTD